MANEAAWTARLARYKGPELKRSLWQLASAAALFAAAWALMYASLQVGYWLTLLLAVPAAFFLIRLFIIQHDCRHAAFFRSTRDRKSTRLNSSHLVISYAVFCLKKKKKTKPPVYTHKRTDRA